MRLNFLQYSCSFLILLFSCNAASWAQNDDASKKSLHFADSVYQLKEYENARSAYEYAARFQPNNTHIQNRLTEINKILAHESTKEADYKTAVSEAKKAFYINDLKKAEEELRKAVSIKSDPSSWAFQKLKEIETLAASQAQLQKDFQTQMTNGNNFLTAKNYEAAEKSFTAALKLIPNDAAATQKLSETQQKIKDRNTDYQKYITEGDRLYQADQILDAKVEYQKALALKPNETYPQQRIEHILSMQAEEADLENRVKNVVQEADQLFTAKNYEAAYTKYQAAIDVYPGHQHSKERLQEIDGILGEARAQQRAYDQAIADADQLLSQQRLQEAKAKYETAKIAKPTESYPQQKITEIDKIIAQQQIDADNFSQFVSQGDNYYEKLQFESAKTAYEQALQLRPKDADVQTKLTNTQSQIAKIDRQYNTLIAQADNQFKIGKIIDAQVVYEEASALKPNEKYPKDQINAIQQRLSTQQEMLEKSYIDALTAGDNFLRNNDFVNAKAEYTKASSIKPKEQTPKDKLAAVDAAIAQQKQTNEQFLAFVKDGDAKFAAKRWSEALTAFQSALTLKADDAGVAAKIANCETEINKAAALESQFNQHVADGDRLFAQQSWNEAKTAYQAALQIKSDKALTDKIKEIDDQLLQEANLEKQYQTLITQADNQLKIKNYIDAQVAYEAALQLKPEETLPKEKLAEIATILKDQQEMLEKSYIDALTAGDNFLRNNDFVNAKAEYTKASSIKPKEQTPKDKLAAVDAAIAQQKQTNEQFLAFVKDGDAKFAAKRWSEALTAFQSALTLKADDAGVAAKIANCETEINKAAALESQFNQHVADGNRLFAQQSWNEAKTAYQVALQIKSDKALTDKIKEIDDQLLQEANLEKQYQTLITQADNQLKIKNYIDAQVAYEAALQLKPEETLPKEKLVEIATILKDQQEMLEKSYIDALTAGDNFLRNNDFVNAKAEYTKASSIKPKEQTPKDKLAAVDAAIAQQKQTNEQFLAFVKDGDAKFAAKRWSEALTAFQSALTLKADDAGVAAKIANCETEINKAADLESQFNQHVADGDRLFAQQSWNEAKTAYQAALQIKSDKALTDKIKEIDDQLLQEANLEKQYQTLMITATTQTEAKQWNAAIESYNKVLSIKPADPTATEKLTYVTEQLRNEQAIEAQYQEWIAKGDEAFQNDRLDEASTAFQKALTLKAEAAYPTQKIAEIVVKKQAHAQRLEIYNQLITSTQTAIQQKNWTKAKTDCQQALQIFPEEQAPKDLMQTIETALAEIEATRQLYNKTIAAASVALSQNNREEALLQYEKAASILPEETLPKTKIQEINAVIAAEKNQEIERQFAALMGEANTLITNKSYELAVDKLEAALQVKQGDVTAQNKLNEVKATIQRLAQLETDYAAALQEGDTHYNRKEYESALTFYEKALALKPNETYLQEQINKTKYNINYSPEKRQSLAKDFVNKGIESMNNNDFAAASISFASATSWYPENTNEAQTALTTMFDKLNNGKVKSILNNKTTIAANTTFNIKTFVGTNDLDEKAFIILKISGKSEKDFNVFIRYGRYSITLGNNILQVIANASVGYYCVLMKGTENDINWMTIMPENSDLTIDEVILVSPK